MNATPARQFFEDNHESVYDSDEDPRELHDSSTDTEADYLHQFNGLAVHEPAPLMVDEPVVRQPAVRRAGYDTSNEQDKQLLCRHCKEDDHRSHDCPNRDNPNHVLCSQCKSLGHRRNDCPEAQPVNQVPVVAAEGSREFEDDDLHRILNGLPKPKATFVPKQQTAEELFEINARVGAGIRNLLGAQIRVWRNEVPIVSESRRQRQTAHGEFTDLGLSPFLLANIQKAGFTHPTPIEWIGIQKMLLYQQHKDHLDDRAKLNKNQMWLTQTGTGKTTAYVLGLIEILSRRWNAGEWEDENESEGKCRPFAVIVVSIHELAEQISQAIKMFSEGNLVQATAQYGGTHVTNSLVRLTQDNKIVVATLGRLVGFTEAGAIDFSKLEYLIFDEFHEYVDSWKEKNMSDQCNRFLELLGDFVPASSRPYSVIMVSAANNTTLRRIAMKMLTIDDFEHLLHGRVRALYGRESTGIFSQKNPLTIVSIGVENTVNPNIDQRFIDARNVESGKWNELLKILENEFEITSDWEKEAGFFKLGHMIDVGGFKKKVLIFVNQIVDVIRLSSDLNRHGFKSVDFHSGLEETDRAQHLRDFGNGWVPVMVATNVAANGLDFGPRGVSHVINYELPSGYDRKFIYIERVGRTGRAGKYGVATTFFDDSLDKCPIDKRWKVLSMAIYLVKLLGKMKLPVPSFLTETVEGYGETGNRYAVAIPDWLQTRERNEQRREQVERRLFQASQ